MLAIPSSCLPVLSLPSTVAQSFSRRGNKGKSKTTVGSDATPGIGGAAAGEKADGKGDAAGGGAAGAADETEAYADNDSKPGLSKPEFKLAGQADPLRESIQQEAVALYEAGAYDDAGERFCKQQSGSGTAAAGKRERGVRRGLLTALPPLSPRTKPPRHRVQRSYLPLRASFAHPRPLRL